MVMLIQLDIRLSTVDQVATVYSYCSELASVVVATLMLGSSIIICKIIEYSVLMNLSLINYWVGVSQFS